MDEVLSLNQAVSDAVLSLTPVEKLKEVKKKIEDELSKTDGVINDTSTGQWIRFKADVACIEFQYLKTIDSLLSYFYNRNTGGNKRVNKFLLFANIRVLLKDSNIKIGQIEKEAGLQNGYTSRLEKLDNTTEPSIEFLVTASKLLKVSVDALISYDFHSLSETELYLLKVIDKFRLDTINNKLEWQTDSVDYLNEGVRDKINIDHPLFEHNVVYFDEDIDYPISHCITTFTSNAFGPTTEIADDCYRLGLKNHSTIFVMNIKRLLARNEDKEGYSKEIWLVNCHGEKECLVSEKNFPLLARTVDNLYTEIKAYAIRPKLSQDTRKILDGFLEDDLSSDDNAFDPNNYDEVPF